MIGFCKFFFNFYEHPYAILPNNKYPVLFLCISLEFIKFVTVYNKIGYTFLDFKLIDNVYINHNAIYCTGYPYSSYYCPNG